MGLCVGMTPKGNPLPSDRSCAYQSHSQFSQVPRCTEYFAIPDAELFNFMSDTISHFKLHFCALHNLKSKSIA